MYTTRRNFLKATAAAAVVLLNMGAGALGKVSVNDKINVVLIGCKNMGLLDRAITDPEEAAKLLPAAFTAAIADALNT